MEYKPSDYMVNKSHKVRHKGKSYIYGDDLPEGLTIYPSWVEQRILILKKEKHNSQVNPNTIAQGRVQIQEVIQKKRRKKLN